MCLMIMLQEGWKPSLPIRLGLMLSLSLLSAAERDPFPQEAPVPGASRQAVLVPALLGLYGIIIAVYVIYQRYCADRSATLTQHDINNTFGDELYMKSFLPGVHITKRNFKKKLYFCISYYISTT